MNKKHLSEARFETSQLFSMSQDFLRLSQVSEDVNSVLILCITRLACEALLNPLETVSRLVPSPEDGEAIFLRQMCLPSIPCPHPQTRGIVSSLLSSILLPQGT